MIFAALHMSLLAHRVGSLRRTVSVAIEGIADIREALLPVGATRMTRTPTSGPHLMLQSRSRLQALSHTHYHLTR